jgi:hypothetical protein
MRASLPIDVPPDFDLMMPVHPRQGWVQTDPAPGVAMMTRVPEPLSPFSGEKCVVPLG